MNKKYTKSVQLIFYLLTLFFGIFFGMSYVNYKVQSLPEYTVTVDDSEQVFRTEAGKKLSPIRYNNNVYIPVNNLGVFLNYMTIGDTTKNLSLYTIRDSEGLTRLNTLSTYDINDNIVNKTVFESADYTVLFVWSSWCKYCKEEIDSFATIEDSGYFTKNSIQFISIPTDLGFVENKDKVDLSVKNNVTQLMNSLTVKCHIYTDSVLRTNFVGNVVSLPKLIIVDNNGNVVQIVDKDITGDELVTLFEGII